MCFKGDKAVKFKLPVAPLKQNLCDARTNYVEGALKYPVWNYKGICTPMWGIKFPLSLLMDQTTGAWHSKGYIMTQADISTLIVDDDPDQLELMCRHLNNSEIRCQLDGVRAGKEALEKLSSGRYDLVILDYKMPHMNGLEVLAEIRKKEFDVPVIMVTGMGDERIAVRALKEGAYDYITKSGDYFTTLPYIIKNTLERHELKSSQEKLTQKLKESEEKYRTLFEDSPIPIWEMDFTAVKLRLDELHNSGVASFRSYFEQNIEEVKHLVSLVKIVGVNQTSVKFFQATGKDALIRNLKSYFHKKSLQIIKEVMISLAEGNTTFECEIPIQTILGEEKSLSLSLVVLREHQKALSRILVTFVDITERKRAEEALKKAHAQLEHRVAERTAELKKTHDQLLHAEKLSAIGKLSASIAHEFNNPLYGIRNVLKGIETRAALDQDDRELVDLALHECERIKRLIKDLQDFNRPTSGVMAPMNLHRTINNILLLMKKEFRTRGIKIEKHFAANVPHIQAVADQIKQVLLNVLKNGVDAIPKGGGKITITTQLLDSSVAIHIQDSGLGISPENIEHIFEPFFTTKSEVKGTGLGLSVSYGIIKRHGGKIEVKSELGNGTTFSIILPIECTDH